MSRKKSKNTPCHEWCYRKIINSKLSWNVVNWYAPTNITVKAILLRIVVSVGKITILFGSVDIYGLVRKLFGIKKITGELCQGISSTVFWNDTLVLSSICMTLRGHMKNRRRRHMITSCVAAIKLKLLCGESSHVLISLVTLNWVFIYHYHISFII